VFADDALVSAPGAGLDVDDVEVLVEELVDRGRCSRVTLLVNLVEETGADPLGLLRSPRAWGTVSVR
jgi:hypothetical protein